VFDSGGLSNMTNVITKIDPKIVFRCLVDADSEFESQPVSLPLCWLNLDLYWTTLYLSGALHKVLDVDIFFFSNSPLLRTMLKDSHECGVNAVTSPLKGKNSPPPCHQISL